MFIVEAPRLYISDLVRMKESKSVLGVRFNVHCPQFNCFVSCVQIPLREQTVELRLRLQTLLLQQAITRSSVVAAMKDGTGLRCFSLVKVGVVRFTCAVCKRLPLAVAQSSGFSCAIPSKFDNDLSTPRFFFCSSLVYAVSTDGSRHLNDI